VSSAARGQGLGYVGQSGKLQAPFKFLMALDLVRERRFAAAEERVADARLRSSLAVGPVARRHFKQCEAAINQQNELENQVWQSQVLPSLEAVINGAAQTAPEAQARALFELASNLGVGLSEGLFERFLDPLVAFSLGEAGSARAWDPSPDYLRAALGPAVEPPAGHGVGVVQQIMSSPRQVIHPDQAGIQVTRHGRAAGNVGHQGVIFDHHGLLLGDGSVVHFDGEPTDDRRAAVRRTSLDAFRGETDNAQLGIAEPVAIRGRAASRLLGNVAALRALAAVGDSEYSVRSRNCEHFANWALLGANYSAQTTFLGQLSRIAQLTTGPLGDPFSKLFNLLLAEDVKIRRSCANIELLSTDGEDPLVLDLARAYWFHDLGDVASWFPLWRGGASLAGFTDRSWCRGARGGTEWTAVCPGVDARPGWHASLVAIVRMSGAQAADVEYFWVTSNGAWFRPHQGVAEIIESRLADVQQLHSAVWGALTETVRRALGLSGRGFSS